MNDDFDDTPIDEIIKKILGDKKKVKKTRREKEEEKREDLIAKENYICNENKYLYTIEWLRNEIYYLIYDNDITNFTLNLKLLDTFYENEDYDKLEEMLKIFKKKDINEIRLYQDKQAIIKFIDVNEDEIKDIINSINTYEESDIVYDALIGTDHITLLPKGYNEARKAKIKYRNSKKYFPATYEQALRRNRHLLEKYLNEIGVGQQRAKKISNLLTYL